MKSIYKIPAFLSQCLLILFLSGCATGYHEYNDIVGGYAETRVNANTYIVTFSGSRYTSMAMVKRYVYHRAAKLTIDAGYRYFIIMYASAAKPCAYCNPRTGSISPTFSVTIKMYQSSYGIPDAMNATAVTTFSEPATYN